MPVRLLPLLFLFMVSCGELDSHWCHFTVTVDGRDGEWAGTRMAGEKGVIGYCFANNGQDLFVRLSVWDRHLQMMILRSGLTVWFDPKGGKDKCFGAHYSRQPKILPAPQHRDAGRTDLHAGLMSLNETPETLVLYRPKEADTVPVTPLESTGVQMAIQYVLGRLICEIRMPLAGNDSIPHALRAGPGQPIGIGFETQAIKMERPETGEMRKGGGRRGSMGGGRRGMGMGGKGRGGGMGRKGGRSMPGGPAGPRMPEPMKLWCTIKLAVNG
jgi:hypothetical protein